MKVTAILLGALLLTTGTAHAAGRSRNSRQRPGRRLERRRSAPAQRATYRSHHGDYGYRRAYAPARRRRSSPIRVNRYGRRRYHYNPTYRRYYSYDPYGRVIYCPIGYQPYEEYEYDPHRAGLRRRNRKLLAAAVLANEIFVR